MNYDLKKPCEGCPFRRDSGPGWLGDYNAPEIVQMARNGENFLCHTHAEREHGYGDIPLKQLEDRDDPLDPLDDDDDGDTPLPLDVWARLNGQQCAGFMIFMRKLCKLPDDPRYFEAAKAIDKDQDILFPPEVFIDHHVNGFDRRMAELKNKRKKQ